MSDHPLPFATRLWFAWICFFRVLLDGLFAARAFSVKDEPPALPATTPAEPKPAPAPEPVIERPRAPDFSSALQLLALLQREGRFIDFLEEDVASFPDADVGAAARVVHEGCRKALREHVTLEPVRTEAEGARVELAAGFDPAHVKLAGDVRGGAPYRGTVRHRGWRAASIALPVAVEGHDARVLAPAEVEL